MDYLGRLNAVTRVLKSGSGKKKDSQYQSANIEERLNYLLMTLETEGSDELRNEDKF